MQDHADRDSIDKAAVVSLRYSSHMLVIAAGLLSPFHFSQHASIATAGYESIRDARRSFGGTEK